MANRYWVGGGSSANWSAVTPTNWSASDGGGNNATVPGATDDVIFNGNGATANTPSTISANITVLSFTVTSGYTNTITHNSVLSVAGNVTLNTSYTIAGTSNLYITAASIITSGGKTWPNELLLTGASTKTLLGNLVIGGILTSGSTNNVINCTTNETLSCAGLSIIGVPATGTAKIILTGGSWTGTGTVLNDLDIAGDVTISSSGVSFKTKTLTYISGTVTTTGSTLTIGASTTLNTNGITWNNIALSGTSTFTLNSLLTATGTVTISATSLITFAGAYGFTFATLTFSNSVARTQTFANGVTYTITTALNAYTSSIGTPLLFTSNHASNRANITLQIGASCNVLANFTRIDASGGRPIKTFNGTITDSPNVFQMIEGQDGNYSLGI
jgi:hypothetical protein